MNFQAPEWLLLIPMLVFAGWWQKGWGLHKPARAACLVLLVLALSDPRIVRFPSGVDVWLLADRSDSARMAIDAQLEQIESIVKDGQGAKDNLNIVDFAKDPAPRDPKSGRDFANPRTQTRLAQSLRLVHSSRKPDRATRVLVVTDGYPTDDLASVTEALAEAHVPVDVRIVREDALAGDYRVTHVSAPSRVQAGEAFMVESAVQGPDGPVTYRIEQDNGTVVGEGKATIEKGSARIRHALRLREGGGHRFTVRVLSNESRQGNNFRSTWTEAVTPPRVLLVTSYKNDPVEKVLRVMGAPVEVVDDPGQLRDGVLDGVRCVFLNDVPSYKMPAGFLEKLAFQVRSQGGGLVMLGGKQSFGSGGYFSSPIDELLPVSLELRQEQRKLSLAMAVVLDRSGSMSMPANGTSGLVKMDLANQGAAQAVELLGEQDQIVVNAVDSSTAVISPLLPVGPNRRAIVERVRRIYSQGGGIFVNTGLRDAWAELKKSDVGTKHIILFADAADAEDDEPPGSYKQVLKDIVDGKGTVSVIGLGTDKDCDAEFLKKIATMGNGRIYFSDNPGDLPALFSQETVSVARSSFTEEITPLKATQGWRQIAARPLAWLGNVDGYNLCYLREQATAAAFSGDEYEAPLVAFWDRGAGRVAAVTFPLAGDHSMHSRRWPEYGAFVQTLARWAMGNPAPEGLGVKTRQRGDTLEVDLHFDETWEQRFAETLPNLVVTQAGQSAARQAVWERQGPGLFRARIVVDGEAPVRGSIICSDQALPISPVSLGSDVEWRTDSQVRDSLDKLVAATGGKELTVLDEVWRRHPSRLRDSMRPLFLLLLIGCFLYDVWATQTNWTWPKGWFRRLLRFRKGS